MRIKNRQAFEQLIRRWDGENGGGAATTGATVTETGTEAEKPDATQQTQSATSQTQETKPFKTFSSETEYQREIDFRIQQALKTHESKLRGKLTDEIRKQLEAEANMTAEQKVQAQMEQLEAEKKALAREKARIKTEALFVAKGIGEAERQVMLDRCVTEDEEESAKNAQALLDAIGKAVKEQIKTAMKEVKAPSSAASSDSETETPDVKYAKDYAARRERAAKQSNEILQHYLGGNTR